MHALGEQAFYFLGSVAFLAHLLSFLNSWLKIADARRKRAERKEKQKFSAGQHLRKRLKDARKNLLMEGTGEIVQRSRC